MRVSDPTSDARPVDIKRLKGGISQMAFHPNGQRIATVSQTGALNLWSAGDAAAELLRLPLPPAAVHNIAFTPDGYRLRISYMNLDRAASAVEVLDGTPR